MVKKIRSLDPLDPTYTATFTAVERPIYGSDRVGQDVRAEEVYTAQYSFATESDYTDVAAQLVDQVPANTGVVYRNVGEKYYELKDHLGNVRVVVNDRKDLDTQTNELTAQVVAYNNYYPFGMPQPGRNFDSQEYRYGFNGKEKDDELFGQGNWQDYGMRVYSPRVGRFPSVDPIAKQYPELTPYQFASNTPIQAIDLDGLEAFYIHGTWSKPSTFPALTKTTVNDIFNNTTGAVKGWSGFNSDAFRQMAGRKYAEHIARNRDPNQALTLVGHSHGGNVGIIAANILKNEYGMEVDNLVTINTPVREYQLDKNSRTTHYNIYHLGDPVQQNGGNDIVVPDHLIQAGTFTLPIYIGGQEFPKGELGNAGQTFDGAINIKVEGFQNWGPTNFHDTHHRPDVFGPALQEAKDKVDAFKQKISKILSSRNDSREMSSQAIDKTAVKSQKEKP